MPAATRPVKLTEETLVWVRLEMAIAFRSLVSESQESCSHLVCSKSKDICQCVVGASDDAGNDELATGVLQYLISVFHGAHPQSSMSLRNSRELRTIAECIDALVAGDLPHLGDLLTQRLKAVQTAVVEGNWNFAQHLELIPTSGSNVVSPAELRAAQRAQIDQMRLQNNGKGGSTRTSP